MSVLNRALGMGRRLAEARMTETVTVGLFEDGTDPATGNPTRVLVAERYAGKARIKYPTAVVQDRSEPSQVFGVQEPLLSIPTGSPAVLEGDEVHVESSAVDAALVGRAYTVQGAPQAGQTTSQRFSLKEL